MSLRGGLRDSFIAGIVLVTPLVITLYVLQLLSGFAFQLGQSQSPPDGVTPVQVPVENVRGR